MSPPKRTAFTTVEVVMSAMIVGILMAVALNTAGAAARSQVDNGDRARAMLIASGLIAEIIEQPFEDPNRNPQFGLEAGESGSNRQQFDDVDDYHNLSSSPQTKQGTALPNSAGLIASAQVSLANPADLRAGASGGVAGLKWVTVKVLRGTKTIATVQGVVAR